MSSLLVTGFGPFEQVEENPSERLARECGERFEIVEVSYSSTQKFIDELDPASFDTLLLMGVHGTAHRFRLEMFAHNRCHKQADVRGHVPVDTHIRSGEAHSLPGTLWPSLNLKECARAANASVSIDPGGYLCNFIYYEALRRFPERKVGFLHVPTFSMVGAQVQKSQLSGLLGQLGR